jgi:hypothetical protein
MGYVVPLLHREFHDGGSGEIADHVEAGDAAFEAAVNDRSASRHVGAVEDAA